MKNFICPLTGNVYAYAADGSDDAFIKSGLVPISDVDLAALQASSVNPLAATLQQIIELEASITPRRWREAVLTGDSSFIKSVDGQIAALRKAL